MKKALLSSLYLLSYCVTDASNIHERIEDWKIAHGLRVANAEERISDEYIQICKESNEKARQAHKNWSELQSDMLKTEDSALISVIPQFSLEPSQYPKDFLQALENHTKLKSRFAELVNLILEFKELSQREMFLNEKYFIKEHRNEAKERVKEYVLEEIQTSSRELTKQETRDIAGLQVIVRKYGIQNFRVIDAESLIEAYNILPAEKTRLLELLSHGSLQDVYEEIKQFVDESFFDERSFKDLKAKYKTSFFGEPTFKQIILETLLNAAYRSPIHRAQIIALIAWSKAFAPMISNLEEHFNEATKTHAHLQRYSTIETKRQIHFICGDCGSFGDYDTITLDLFNVSYGALYGVSSDFSNSYILYQQPITRMLFHEIGHIILSNIASVISSSTLTASGLRSMAVASEGFEIERDENAIQKNMEKIAKLNTAASIALMSQFSMPFFHIAPDTPVNFFSRFQNSNAAHTEVNEFQSEAELMQILGLFEKENIFYINKLSDFVASAFEGLPLRINHKGVLYGRKPIDSLLEFAPPTLQLVPYVKNIHLNPEFFKTLLFANGLSPAFYRERARMNDPYANMWIIPMRSLSWALKYMNTMTKDYLLNLMKRRKTVTF